MPQYYDADVIEDIDDDAIYADPRSRGNTTTRRYKPGMYSTEDQVQKQGQGQKQQTTKTRPVAARTSRNTTERPVPGKNYRAPQYRQNPNPRQSTQARRQDEKVIDELSGRRKPAARKESYRDPDTRQDRMIRQSRSQKPRLHALFYLGGLIGAFVILWVTAIFLSTCWTNDIADPGYYTQAAHRDAIVITTKAGGQQKAQAIIDPAGHLDLVLLPANGDMSKAKIIPGPTLTTKFDHPDQAMVSVFVDDGQVFVDAIGPVQDNWLTSGRPEMEWTVQGLNGVSTPKQQEGGRS